MTLAQQLHEYIAACFTGIWIESHEHVDGLAEIARLCRDNRWQLAVWDLETGLSGADHAELSTAGGAHDPLTAIRTLAAIASPEGTTLLVLQNFHRFLQSAEIVQALLRQVIAGKQQRNFVVILAPIVEIPLELEKLFVVVEHALPGREQLAEIAHSIASEDGEVPPAAEFERVLDAAGGLTRYEAEGAFSLSLVRHGRLEPSAIWELKSQFLAKTGLLALHHGGESFAQLGGLDSLKAFCRRAMRPGAGGPARVRSRGVLLLGVPGTGKSQFCKALGNETGRPTLVLDVGSLMGSLVGLTEQRTRQALRVADAMTPCVLMLDEVEKALAGAVASGPSDSGVSARLFGTLLSWLNDHESDVFVVCTANDVSKLPPEFARAERFDGIFFLDLPTEEQRQAIWQLYLQQFQLDCQQRRPPDTNWTGAEIRACCRLAALLDVPLVHAAQNIVPVATTAAEAVTRLREWATGRCLAADRPGIYTARAAVPGRRRVSRDPTSN